ncbi:hypothetical protein ZOSMA_26G00340 [Zostera marina]|uniref:Uncharacterized protein n=1 Tax=Zostera marina TaxID=29655 RepID=A0A0K9PGE2_ZOSMR|nr:hypothetical protein ZOSMA_26G00340 [Zostera marina]
MPYWWGKKSLPRDDKKKKSKENSPRSQHPLISPRERKGIIRLFWNRSRSILTSSKRSSSRPVSRSTSPSSSSQFARCQSFNHTINSPIEPQSLPAPSLMDAIPRIHIRSSSVPSTICEKRGNSPLTLPIQQHSNRLSKSSFVDNGKASATSSSDGDDNHTCSQSHRSPGNGLKNGSKIAAVKTISLLHNDQTSHYMPQKTSRESVMSTNYSLNNPLPLDSPSPRYRVINTHQTDILNSRNCLVGSALENSMPSPCTTPTPRRMLYYEEILTPTVSTGNPYTDFNVHGCCHCSINPSLHSQQNRRSLECCPISSSQMTSLDPGYKIRSGNVTPKHPLSNCTTLRSPASQTYDKMKQDLPLSFTPESSIKDLNTSMFSSTINSPSIHFNSENTKGSHWKKGKMIGRGEKSLARDDKKKKSKENSPRSQHPLISPRERKGIIRLFWNRSRSILTSSKRSSSRLVSWSTSPSSFSQFVRCQSFNHTINSSLESQKLPAPTLIDAVPRIHIRSPSIASTTCEKRGNSPLTLPIRQHSNRLRKSCFADNGKASATSSSDGDGNHTYSQSHSSLGNGLKNGSKIVAVKTSSLLRNDQTSHYMPQKTSRESIMSANYSLNNPLPLDSPSPRYRVINTHQTDILNSRNCLVGSAPENPTPSLCTTPRRMLYCEEISTPTISARNPYTNFNFHGCCHCSINPSLHSQQNRRSPEYCPISSS